MLRFLASLSLTCSLAFSAHAGEWPQFLGPLRNNTTAEAVEPWKGDLKPLWKMPVGEGHSSPVFARGTVYTFYQPKGKNADALAAFDPVKGELLWEKSYERPEFTPLFGNGPRSTPAVSGGWVYTLGGTGILACWNGKTGEIAWKVDTLKEFHAKNLLFGISTSPVIIDDKVIVMVGGKGAGVVAFDTKTGKTVWQATDDPASYSSPVYTDGQLVVLTGSHLRGLSAGGEKLWEVPFKDKLNESSTTPIMAGRTVIASSVTAGTIAERVAKSEGVWSNELEWKKEKLTCYFSTPVVVGKYLYMVNGAAKLTNASITLRCVELATGNVAWEKSGVGNYHAAIIRCGLPGKERLLMLDDNGFLTLFEPDAKEFKQLVRTKVCGKTWAHPALVDGNLYLRDDHDLMCIPLK
jgi:outer membrane protein assembly factor BamB